MTPPPMYISPPGSMSVLQRRRRSGGYGLCNATFGLRRGDAGVSFVTSSSERSPVLESAEIAAVVPVSDIDKACEFYGEKLGLKLDVRRDDLPQNREAEFRAGDGTLVVYESVGAGQSRATVAGFRVADIDAAVAGLRERGVEFEEYDMPDLKTENGIVTIGDLRAAWAKDQDGNIIAFESRTG